MAKSSSKYSIYLVGGAVRDQLLGLDISDRDYVVVGASDQTLRDEGFLQVGLCSGRPASCGPNADL